ncbi:QWRF family [Dillenia turbinata]|uniref:QWRF family n=1 Tax=Dillenia turbinata TaxID=194707 RepID=A0AAN8ZHZ1_9MAGN
MVTYIMLGLEPKLDQPFLVLYTHNFAVGMKLKNVTYSGFCHMIIAKCLYDAWDTISKLRHSVRDKRNELQLMKQNLKVSSILTAQMKYLEEWARLDQDHSSSLSGLGEVLKANTLRLPLGGARVLMRYSPIYCPLVEFRWSSFLQADVQQMKDAVCSAVDVMQATAFSICFLLPKAEDVNSLTGELASIISNERGLLSECKDLLSTVAAMQIDEIDGISSNNMITIVFAGVGTLLTKEVFVLP